MLKQYEKLEKAILRTVPPRQSRLPILGSVEIGPTVEGVYSHLRANNLDLGAEVRIHNQDGAEGELALLSWKYALNHMGQEWQKNGDGHVTFQVGAGTARYASKPLEEFPRMLSSKVARSLELPVDRIRDAVRFVSGAESADLTRPALCAWCLSPYGHLIATDGHCLTKIRLTDPFEGKDMLISPQALKLLSVGPWDSVTLSEYERGGFLELRAENAEGSAVMQYRAEGLYPDWKQVMPKGTNRAEYTVDVETLKAATKVACAVASSVTHLITLTLTPSGGTVEVKYKETESSAAFYCRRLVGSSDEPFIIGFNVLYLDSIIGKYKAAGAEEVIFSVDGADRAAIISAEGMDSQALLMPLRLED
jgi:DNA polymerase III sliding clamp (beta) subunit (PCNA family)